jgi:multidrug efflux pump subunit AcrB
MLRQPRRLTSDAVRLLRLLDAGHLGGACEDRPPGGQRSHGAQAQYTLTDVDNQELNFYAPKLLKKLQALPQLTSVASGQQSTGRTPTVEIDREAASRFGIDPAKVDSTLYDAFGQRHVARIFTALNQYFAILEVEPTYQLGPNARTSATPVGEGLARFDSRRSRYRNIKSASSTPW